MKLPFRSAQQSHVKLLQITDTHLFSAQDGTLLSINTGDSFQAVVDTIVEQGEVFDALVSSGDISQDHSEASYRKFAQGIEPLELPCFWLPGNHDYQPNMQAALEGGQIMAQTHVLLGDKWQMILLDSQVAKVPHGKLSSAQLTLLDEKLAQHPERHTLVWLHHNSLPVGSAWLDQHILKNRDEFWQVVQRHNNVKTVVCGHVHQEVDVMHQGVRVLATPSTCVQFKPDSHEFALDAKSPGWREIELLPDGSIETQVKRLPTGQFQPDFSAAGY